MALDSMATPDAPRLSTRPARGTAGGTVGRTMRRYVSFTLSKRMLSRTSRSFQCQPGRSTSSRRRREGSDCCRPRSRRDMSSAQFTGFGCWAGGTAAAGVVPPVRSATCRWMWTTCRPPPRPKALITRSRRPRCWRGCRCDRRRSRGGRGDPARGVSVRATGEELPQLHRAAVPAGVLPGRVPRPLQRHQTGAPGCATHPGDPASGGLSVSYELADVSDPQRVLGTVPHHRPPSTGGTGGGEDVESNWVSTSMLRNSAKHTGPSRNWAGLCIHREITSSGTACPDGSSTT